MLPSNQILRTSNAAYFLLKVSRVADESAKTVINANGSISFEFIVASFVGLLNIL